MKNKRLYLASTPDTVTYVTMSTKLLNIIIDESITLQMGEVESKCIPLKVPSTYTRDAYTEQKIENKATGEIVAIIREAKIETLDKLPNPFSH